MNIQFMTREKNGVPTGEFDWRNEERCKFIPDFEEMIKNASCEEEVIAIKEVQEMIDNDLFDGFAFEIVYMAYCKSVDFFTGKSTMKWQMLQHPWYRDQYGYQRSKEKMIKEIAVMTVERLKGTP